MGRERYVPNFKAPGRHKPSGRMWLTALLCVGLPPVGLLLLWWKARCPIRGKVLLSILAVAVMVFGLTLLLEARNPAPVVALPTQPVVTYGTTPDPTVAPAPENVAPENGGETPALVPANPIG